MCAAKKEKAEPTLAGVMVAAVINLIVGVAVGFCVLAGTAPAAYTPTPKKAGDPPPPLPSVVWYWAGEQSGGDWRGKEETFLAGGAGALPLLDAELNTWGSTVFKALPPAGPAVGKPGAAPADAPTFKAVAGVPNFRSWHGKDAPQGYFQIAMPFSVAVLGFNVEVLYQARGTFSAGANGPQFNPTYTSFGSARVSAALAGMVFKQLAAMYTPADAVKKYAAAWAKQNSAEPQDGQLVLGHP